ncbi:hypothetical protein Vretifemale_1110 [Volvox reticuliferus]|uniref:F-box domain-containing protein n=2 Tax=Volvox reticuliferus TaxID=1737510 RepID=A0A8J4BZK8_9CHLO|nr:hypothetical protein Vretifemale_1110 [Volvox reticuliferus]
MSLSVTTEFVRQFFDLFTQPAYGKLVEVSTVCGQEPLAKPTQKHFSSIPSPGACIDTTPSVELTADALEQIFMRCDIDALVGVVPAVCKSWRHVVSSSGLWRHRLSPKLMGELDSLAALGPPLAPSSLFLIMQGRNFLRNPTFRRDANTQPQLGRAAARSKYQRCAWVTTTAMGDGILWEAPPAGMRTYGTAATANPPSPLPYPGTVPRLPTQQHPQHLQGFFGNGSGGFGIWGSAVRGRDEHQPGCLATANDWCEVVQVVDLDWELQHRGLTAARAAHLLDAELSLRLSVHVGARWDCVGQYSVGLLLDEGNGNANGYGYGTGNDGQRPPHGSPATGVTDDSIPCLQSFVLRPTRHHFYTGRVICTSDTWQRFEYVLPACPRGFRRAVVILRGRRAPNSLIVSPMPRFCGAKFASAELVFS